MKMKEFMFGGGRKNKMTVELFNHEVVTLAEVLRSELDALGAAIKSTRRNSPDRLVLQQYLDKVADLERTFYNLSLGIREN